jgi:ATPase family associated with various cellular activities (AAA)
MELSSKPFTDIPQTPRGHLGLLLYEGVFRIICCLRVRAVASDKTLEMVFEEFPFLGPYFAEIRHRLPADIDWIDSLRWLSQEIERWEGECPVALPLRALQQELKLRREALLVFALLGLAEEDAQFAALFSKLQSSGARQRPTLGLLRTLMEAEGAANPVEVWDLSHTLSECALTEVLNPGVPRADWELRVSPAVWSAARGDQPTEPMPGLRYSPGAMFLPLAEAVWDPVLAARLQALLSLLAERRTQLLVLRGMPGCERLGVAGAVAKCIGCGVLEVSPGLASGNERWATLGPLATMLHAIPVFSPELSAGETFDLPLLSGYSGPLIVILGAEGGIAGRGSERSVTIPLLPESAAARLRLWQRHLNGYPVEDLAGIADRFVLPGRYLKQACDLAKAAATVENRSAITHDDVRTATRAINRQQLDSLAACLPGGVRWPQLVVNGTTFSALAALQRRCRLRETLAATSDSFPGGLNTGVRALFEGPSGTGKTLAARALASELGLDLYRVDLSSIVNKYVGETEKNLGRVLARAEDLNVVLLLDEGDSLLARRTDVRTSNDRYANLETNYLLQRLETYTGIALITTNLGNAIDSAFRRRMDAVVKFHLPDGNQRWELWAVHLPQGHQVSQATLMRISMRYALTGGQIRNASVHATLLALDRGSSCVDDGDLVAAIQLEYRKAGASFPGEGEGASDASHHSLGAFLRAIS